MSVYREPEGIRIFQRYNGVGERGNFAAIKADLISKYGLGPRGNLNHNIPLSG